MLTRWHQLSKKAQWLIAIGVLFGVFIIIGALAGTSDEPTSVAPTAAETVTETAETVTETVTEDSSEDSTETVTEDSTEDSSSGLTPGQENAVRSAESYLNTSAFSRKGLIEQLKYEGYSTAEATFAVDNVTVDWNEQAALSAEAYLRTSSFSRSGLLEQLLYEGFTRAQATYGVSQAY